MVKLRYNLDKHTYAIKGLSYEHLSVLAGLVHQTKLGMAELPYKAFELSNLFETECVEPCQVEVDVESDGYFTLLVS